MLSHELRNPLAPIMTAVQLMKLRGDVPAPREREIIERQTAHVMRLIEDLLDVSRIAQGKVELRKRPLDLAAVVAQAVETTAPLFDQKQQHLSVDVPDRRLTVDGDEARLGQIVANLLSNASRYTPPGGHVGVTARAVDGEIRLSVRDDGVGISPELLARIFEPFVQERRPDAPQSGLGLGLALVRSLTALHGGQVQAYSEGPGRGSEFVLRLPAMEKEATSGQGAAAIQTVTAGVRRRILLVDDNEDAAELLSMLLIDAGHTVQIAHDAATALSLAPSMAPDVALLDIGLPVMDGYQLGTELRRRLGAQSPALVALTGYGQEKDRQRTAAAGFAAHLVKPIDPQHLLNVIETLVTPAGEAGTA